MGDVIHTLYAVSALRAALPELRIGWVVEERWAELLCAKSEQRSGIRTPGRPLIDSLHVVNTKAWRRAPLSSANREQIKNALSMVRAQTYEVAADFQGAIKSAMMARFAGTKSVIGMTHPREAPARLFYHRHLETRGTHVIEQYRSLAGAITGQSLPAAAIEFPRDEQAETTLGEKLANIGEEIVILNPGAGWAAKQWPAERYGEVSQMLAKDGLWPLINFGPSEEKLARTAETASAGLASTISCSISELIALTRRARLFIGGDTGPMHLAAALRVPVVAIFGPTDPARNGPYGARSVVLRHGVSRSSLSHTSTPDPGLAKITTNDVIAAARQLLKDTHA